MQTVYGGSGADTVTLGAAANNASVDLAAGNDVLNLGNFNNTLTISNTSSQTAMPTGMTLQVDSAASNPTIGVKLLQEKTRDGFHTWTAEEIDNFWRSGQKPARNGLAARRSRRRLRRWWLCDYGAYAYDGSPQRTY